MVTRSGSYRPNGGAGAPPGDAGGSIEGTYEVDASVQHHIGVAGASMLPPSERNLAHHLLLHPMSTSPQAAESSSCRPTAPTTTLLRSALAR